MKWHQALGINPEKFRFHEHDKLAHYANAAFDIEFEFPFGFKEVEGIHSRTDFDLVQHQKHSGKKIHMYTASGFGGQHIMVFPELNAVVVFTGGNFVTKRPPFMILEKYVLPAFD